jgi:hypothetical protein
MKLTQRAVLLLIVLAGTLGLARLSPAQSEGQPSRPVTTSLMIPFPSSATVNGEVVDFTGAIHLVVQAHPGDPSQIPTDPCRIDTHLVDVSGVGETSGEIYYASGAARFEFEQPLPNTYQFSATYRLISADPAIPTDPCHCISLQIQVGVREDGTVGEATASAGAK